MKNILIYKEKPKVSGFYLDKAIDLEGCNVKLSHIAYIDIDNRTNIFNSKGVVSDGTKN